MGINGMTEEEREADRARILRIPGNLFAGYDGSFEAVIGGRGYGKERLLRDCLSIACIPV